MQTSGKLTIAAGTPQQLSTTSVLATRLIIQCQPAAGDGLIYIFRGVPAGTTPSTSTFPHLTLAAGSATAPSDEYSDSVDYADGFGFDLARIWIDGSHTGDVVTFSPNLKI